MPTANRRSIWSIRVLLAALLLFGSEVLLWTNPVQRPVGEWLLLIPGYVALSTLLLDLIVRYRVRDLWGLMTLAGIYGLCAGMLLNPQTTLIDLPRTLVTRAMGAHTLVGLEMIGLFLALTNGKSRVLRRLLLVGSAIVGVAWGVWARWSPTQTDATYGEIPLTGMLMVGVVSLVVILGVFALVVRRSGVLSSGDLMLSLREMALLILGLAALLFIRIFQNALSGTALIVVPVLLVFCLTIQWFRRNTKKPTLLDACLPVAPLAPGWIALAIVIFGAASVIAYDAPLIGNETINQLWVVVVGFTLYGLGWLPLVSAVLGVRAYIRQVATQKL
jgi:hypothetical protein